MSCVEFFKKNPNIDRLILVTSQTISDGPIQHKDAHLDFVNKLACKSGLHIARQDRLALQID
jgi:hypothetical protein